VRPLLIGLALTGGVTALMVLGWGRGALVPGLAFGGLATAIQVTADRMVRPGRELPLADFARRWVAGMGLRLVGVVLVAVAASLARETFPPLPTALGFLGVLVPLLFTEIRFAR
jgi:hypothetical protein